VPTSSIARPSKINPIWDVWFENKDIWQPLHRWRYETGDTSFALFPFHKNDFSEFASGSFSIEILVLEDAC
jgi:hypothetical protein